MPRRKFLQECGLGFGSLALLDMLSREGAGADRAEARDVGERPVLERLHFPPRAKRIIFLFQSGGPSQLDLFDYKPLLNQLHGQELPAEVRMGQRLTGMSGNQSQLPLVGSPYKFQQHGECGAWVSELLPHTAAMVDELCIIKSMHSEAINHGPAVTYVQTGSQLPGRPSIGAWLNYGLGTENADLPSFVVMVTKGAGGQPLQSRLWGSGFLPSVHQGVQFRSGPDPVLYLNSPPGLTGESRRRMLDTLGELHREDLRAAPDPQIETRISQYELAYRMQTAIPEATNLADEPDY
ncbi:MAG: DUF1501 domain-containing protein, partial [Planctomycetales bacterium]|nr:DUF1501 domain-containing protein [Planctomycetales bacterium]